MSVSVLNADVQKIKSKSQHTRRPRNFRNLEIISHLILYSVVIPALISTSVHTEHGAFLLFQSFVTFYKLEDYFFNPFPYIAVKIV